MSQAVPLIYISIPMCLAVLGPAGTTEALGCALLFSCSRAFPRRPKLMRRVTGGQSAGEQFREKPREGGEGKKDSKGILKLRADLPKPW